MNNPQNLQISPVALLAAVLYHCTDTVKAMVKPDDSDTEIEIDVPLISVQKEADTVVCMIPMSKIMHFATHVYDMQFNVAKPKDDLTDDNAMAVVAFSPHKGSLLVNGAGSPISTGNNAIDALMKKIEI